MYNITTWHVAGAITTAGSLLDVSGNGTLSASFVPRTPTGNQNTSSAGLVPAGVLPYLGLAVGLGIGAVVGVAAAFRARPASRAPRYEEPYEEPVEEPVE
ncbi:MAG: hypothetical protein L3J73_01375 [Thermoplasmata archaeon]|nr:hypothetical protein [Thermoplasmata archaeon]